MGPLFFILYINDLYRVCSELTFVLFADDTNVFIKGRNLKETIGRLNEKLVLVNEWFNINELSLNVQKTHYMIFSNCTNRSHDDVIINGRVLERVKYTNFLGVIIDDKLSWKYHINHIKGKMSKSIGILQKVKYIVNKKWRLKLYNTFVLPHINYCNAVWGSTYATNLKPVHILQKKALKCALGYSRCTRCTNTVFNDSGMLKLENISKVQIAIFM